MFDRAQAKVTRVAVLLMLGAVVALAATATSEASGDTPASHTSNGGRAPVAQEVLPPPGPHPFTPAVTTSGVTLTTYSGGTVADLDFELQVLFNGGARAVITVNGKFVILIPNAPAFVNAPFQDFAAGFPGGISAGTALLIVVDPYPAEIQEALDQARAAWAAAGSADYDMTMSVSCFCLLFPEDPDASSVDIEVRDGQIVSGTTDNGVVLSEVPSLFLTVEALFDEIQDAIDARAARIDAIYHASGYPLSVFIDRVFLIADEEIGYSIHELTLR